jgi:succinyl-diaminopimelate desuccinylase
MLRVRKLQRAVQWRMATTPLDAIELTRALVRAASPSRRESPAAAVLEGALRELGYDRVWRDEAGNVLGEIVRGDGPTLLLNGHLDVVPAGDEALWPHPPFGGVLHDGAIWGRGACDMKGAVASLAVAGAEAAAGDAIAGRILMTGVVQEEIGGLGARHLAATERADVVILGEPSDLRLMLGHRGRLEVWGSFPGRIAHAAKAELGENALERAARFVGALAGLELPSAPGLGRSSVTPTSLRTFPEGGANVVPGRAELVIDYRNVPGDDRAAVLARLRALDLGASFDVPPDTFASEDGRVRMELDREGGSYLVDEGHPAVVTARRVLSAALGREVEVGTWWFATDAPYLAALGAPIIGFGPGDPELAHTHQEHVRIEDLVTATRAYRALIGAYLGRNP